MDIKAYIDSGILEQYVLGLLSEDEMWEVQQRAVEHPAIRQEIEEIEDALQIYSLKAAKVPPAGMEEAILKAIKGEIGEPQSDSSPDPKNQGPTNNLGSSWKIPFIIAAIGLLGSLAFAFQNFNAKQNITEQLSVQTEKMKVDQLACDEVKQQNDFLNEQLELLRSATNKTIRMKGTDKAPAAIATIYWDNTRKKTYLDVNSLPSPPSDKQYQLWAIVDGVPVDMGVFDVALQAAGLQEVPYIENPQAFAVTLENKGGSPTPTLEEMYVLGQV